MKRLGVGVAVLVLCLGSMVLTMDATVSVGAHAARSWAVVVGLNSYLHGNVVPLHCAVNDSRMVRRTLVEACGFPERNTLLLNTDDWGRDASTRENIENAVRGFLGRIGPDDTMVFFFSGHGVEMEGESYLLTFEADPSSTERIKATSLKVSDLRAWLKQMKCSRILLFADACRSDPRVRGSRDPRPSQATPRGGDVPHPARELALDSVLTGSFAKDLVVELPETPPSSRSPLPIPNPDSTAGPVIEPAAGFAGDARFAASFLSCDIGQRSYEWEERNMGFFSYFLCRGLRGDADDTAHAVTLTSLCRHLADTVPQAVATHLSSRQVPRTHIQGSNAAQSWVLSRPETRVALAPVPPPTLGTGGSIRTRTGGGRITCAVDVIGNNIETRGINELTHRMEEYYFEVDKQDLRERVVATLDGTGKIQCTRDEKTADMWFQFHVCPTSVMQVDLLLRDRETGAILARVNEEINRPYPGDKKQLADLAIKILRNRMVKTILDRVSTSYQM